MFEVGFTEIIVILGLALLVLGPEKLPGLAAKVGRWTGRARSMARQLRTQLEQEVSLEEMAKTRTASSPTPEAANTTPESTAAADSGTSDTTGLDAQASHDYVHSPPHSAISDVAAERSPADSAAASDAAKANAPQ